jgi:ribosome-associated translation inhibitor RaiA
MVKKTLKATGFELSPSIAAAVDKVVEAIDRYVDPDDTSAMADIEVARTTQHHRSGFIFRAEINFHSRIGDLRIESIKEDLYVALAAAKDELVETLRSKKAKKTDFIRRSGLRLKNMLKGLPWRKKGSS